MIQTLEVLPHDGISIKHIVIYSRSFCVGEPQ